MSEHSEHLRAQVLAALYAGQSYTQVSQLFGVPIGTLKGWKSRDKHQPDGVTTGATPKRERIGELLLEYLVVNLETLKTQQVFFRDETWLKQQSASELAVLHGVSADKALRLLEGLADQNAEDE